MLNCHCQENIYMYERSFNGHFTVSVKTFLACICDHTITYVTLNCTLIELWENVKWHNITNHHGQVLSMQTANNS